jgi:hypothetical protein
VRNPGPKIDILEAVSCADAAWVSSLEASAPFNEEAWTAIHPGRLATASVVNMPRTPGARTTGQARLKGTLGFHEWLRIKEGRERFGRVFRVGVTVGRKTVVAMRRASSIEDVVVGSDGLKLVSS